MRSLFCAQFQLLAIVTPANARGICFPFATTLALSSDNVEEKVHLVETLVKASAGTLWMHESFDVNNPRKFTRS